MKTQLISTALLTLILSACVSNTFSPEQLQKREAAKARVEVGIGYLYQGDFAQAKLNLDKAMAHAPDYYFVHSALAYYYQLQGNTEAANAAYLQAIKLDSSQGDVYNNYGAFLCTQAQYAQSYEQFKLALAAPNYYNQANTLANLAQCALSAKDTALYQESMEKLEKLDATLAKKLKKIATSK